VASMSGIEAEAIEFRVEEGTPIAGKALKDIRFPDGGIVGTITRGPAIIIPRGDDTIQPGDEVIVFALPHAIPEVEELFA